MKIQTLDTQASADWLRLRLALWPDASASEHEEEMAEQSADPARYGQWLARSEAGEALGLAEASLRHDYVNGTESSPVAFLEGLYVRPESRRQGVSRALLAAVAAWARERGCSELASDTSIDNTQSQAVHARLGFQETERVIYFNMALGKQPEQR